MKHEEVRGVLEEEKERLKKQSEYYSGISYQVNAVGNVIEAISIAIEWSKEKEVLSKCPHGKVTVRDYCRECSLKYLNDEYDHAQDLKAENARLREENERLKKELQTELRGRFENG